MTIQENTEKAKPSGLFGDLVGSETTTAKPASSRVPAPVEHKLAFTVFDSAGALTKSYSIDAETKRPTKSGSPGLSVGSARRVELSGTAPQLAKALIGELSALTPNQALGLVPVSTARELVKVVTKDALADHPGAVARTKAYFKRQPGPALLGLDFDVKDWPDYIRARVAATPGQLTGVLTEIFSAFGKACTVLSPSASTGITNVANGLSTGANSGQHRYLFAMDGADIDDFAERLFNRLVLAGFGFASINKSGTVSLRALIDKTPTKGAERLWYEADAILDGGLVYEPGARVPKLINPNGGFIDTSKLPALADEETHQLATITEQIIQAAADEAAQVKGGYVKSRVAEFVADGAAETQAEIVVRAALDSQQLIGDFRIHLDDGRWVSVSEILADPKAYHRKTCADPIEPDYGSGRNLAIIYTDSTPRIFSQAHGGGSYDLCEDYAAKYYQPLVTPNRRGLSVVDGLVNYKSIPVREHLIEPRLPIGDVTQCVGEPGISKSTFAIRDALVVATGRRDLLCAGSGGPVEQLHATGAVIIYNAEDRKDEMERRLAVVQRHVGIPDEQMRHPIILWSGVDAETLTIMHRPNPRGPLVRALGADLLEERIGEYGAKLVVLDPQVSLMSGGVENSNDDMNALLQELANIAAKHRCCVEIIHHTSKASRDHRGDMGAGRGGFAAIGKVRSAFTLTNVTGVPDDEKKWGVSADDQMFRLDYAKISHARKPTSPIVYRRVNVAVGNGYGYPKGVATALFKDDPAERLKAEGDYAPVLELVDIEARIKAGAGRKVDDEAAIGVTQIVNACMGDLDECELAGILETVGEQLRQAGLTTAKNRASLTGFVTAVLIGKGQLIERNGQIVRVLARKKAGGSTAPWFVCRKVEAPAAGGESA